jgi:hypothetical protein
LKHYSLSFLTYFRFVVAELTLDSLETALAELRLTGRLKRQWLVFSDQSIALNLLGFRESFEAGVQEF